MAVTIRPARAEDYEAILAVWREAGLSVRVAGRDARAAFCRQLTCFGESYLVATDDERVVGVVLGTHDGRKGWINRLAVVLGYRRRRVARRLVTACEGALRGAGIEIIAALVEPDNAVSARLFEGLGYAADVPVIYFRKLSRPNA